ncbi:MAG TPA: aldehyde dehydrogenase [Tepidisphaeraceae bacterium]|nr:aldehyde dehydrogenase [Tepidisphaeraceae bacterium]
MNQTLVQDVVAEVMKRLGDRRPSGNGGLRAGEDAPANDGFRRDAERHPHRITPPVGQAGVFDNIDQAVSAATESQKKLLRLSMDDRDAIVKLIKSIARQKAHEWGKLELDETKIGRLDHKIEKLQILEGIPGVEFLRTDAFSGSKGLALDEYAPFGVIGCITPVTHSIPTLTCNAINMIASGNALVINAHPSGANCAAVAVAEYNKQISAKFGIEAILTCVLPPTLETAEALFQHRGVPLLVVTGGAAVARAALAARKRAIVAGPGNPPVVVDETACLSNAADSIIKGAAYDNNLLCIGEKEVFCVESVFEKLLAQMEKHGGFLLNDRQIDALTKAAFQPDPKDGKLHVNKDFVGKDPSFLADAAGVRIPPQTQILFGETTADHVFVQEEQMMPFVPFVRVRNVDEAIELALQAEHGYRHTAVIHSRNTDTITKFGRLAATTIFVANGPSVAGLGGGAGEGYGSFSIATPTGEGITTPLTFTRSRRVAIAGAMRMI